MDIPVDDARRSYIYIAGGEPRLFRQFFAQINVQPGMQQPTSGSIMNKELQLVIPSGERWFAVSMTGDRAAWKAIVRAFCTARGIKTAEVIDTNVFATSDGNRVPIKDCGVLSSHGIA